MFPDVPLLLCVNLQSEFIAGDASQWIADSAKTIELCLAVQSEWRAQMWPIAHLRRIASAGYFDPAGKRGWIVEAKPQSAELIFDHPLPSAYSSAKFREYMQQVRPVQCVVIGCSLNDSIIATVIDGYHRGDSFAVLVDAVSCNRNQDALLKMPTLAILQSFARVTNVPPSLNLPNFWKGSSPDRSPSGAIRRP